MSHLEADVFVGKLLAEFGLVEEARAASELERVGLKVLEDEEPLADKDEDERNHAKDGDDLDHRRVGCAPGRLQRPLYAHRRQRGQHHDGLVGEARGDLHLIGVLGLRAHCRVHVPRRAQHGECPLADVGKDEREHQADPERERARHLEPLRVEERLGALQRRAAIELNLTTTSGGGETGQPSSVATARRPLDPGSDHVDLRSRHHADRPARVDVRGMGLRRPAPSWPETMGRPSCPSGFSSP